MPESAPPARSLRKALRAWAADAPAEIVLGVPEQQAFVDRLAAEIAADLPDVAELRAVEAEARALPDVPLSVELAIKLALSHRLVLDHPDPVHLSVVFAV